MGESRLVTLHCALRWSNAWPIRLLLLTRASGVWHELTALLAA